MPRGGKRKGAGRKSGWASGCKKEDTQSMRIPKYILKEVHEIAHRLDAGEKIDWDAQSKIGEFQQRITELEQKLSELNTGHQLELVYETGPTKEELEEYKSKALAYLNVGKQSNTYKRGKKALEYFADKILKAN